MSTNSKHDKDQADVYDIRRLSGKFSKEDIDSLIEQGAVAVLLTNVAAGAPTFTRAALLGVAGIEGDIYADIKVNGAVVDRLTIKAKYGQELRAWAVAFSTASKPNRPAADHGSPAVVLARLNQLHDDGLLTDDEFTAKRAEVIGRM
jgi:Short C-terminal domain